MIVNLAKFNGSLPYASELYGVYQPLLGWRSARLANRFGAKGSAVHRSLAAALTEKMRPSYSLTPPSGASAAEGAEAALTITPGKTAPGVVSALPSALDTVVSRELVARLQREDLTDPAVWDRLVGPEGLAALLRIAESKISQGGGNGGNPHAAGLLADADADKAALAARESQIAGTLKQLQATGRYDVLHAMYAAGGRLVDVPVVDALAGLLGAPVSGPRASAAPSPADASLSPLGLVHLFRQYFFEFDSFLGPPVQHIWLSPGASVELIETSTRRTLTERTTEAATETTDRTERESTVQDELAASVRDENENSTKFGVSLAASASGGIGVFNTEASASTSYETENTRRAAKEKTHKQLRQQTIKLSTEIKRSFKSTFKTVVETTDTSSKRYLLQNTTDELVNYELRRKMRQVGVQVQDIGTQMCWQTYVDRPGDQLGTAKLVHIAQPPESQVQPTQLIPVPEEYEETVEGSWKGPDDDEFDTRLADRVLYPKHGFTYQRHGDVQWLNNNVAALEIHETAKGSNVLAVRIVGHSEDEDVFSYRFTVTYAPSAAYRKEIEDQNKERLKQVDQEKERAAKEAFYKAAQERVEIASEIAPRPFADLREEERIVVYRDLVRQLFTGAGLSGGTGQQAHHVMAELVQSLFDVEKMLYFVAPEWWVPNKLAGKQHIGVEGGDGTQEFEKSTVVTWGSGISDADDYYITAGSAPARLGSSLGWLLQLDGDNLRNAFLNAPWVKAIVPIRQGKEFEALDWLTNAGVEGTDGLDSLYVESVDGERARMLAVLKSYVWKDPNLAARYRTLTADRLTLHDAVRYLAVVVSAEWQKSRQKVSDRLPDGTPVNYLPTDKVYERGFDPLEKGFEAGGAEPFKVFDTWIEILPTDQIVASEVRYDPKTGMQI
ncbi:hypothetical protein [Streptomyces sp. NPDC059063]|uniref:hypothetical protein n=1 Tax=unclassified Streptomyces TaxID=2593676 RepID=UPI003681752B